MGAGQDQLFAWRPPQGFAIDGEPLTLGRRLQADPEVSKDEGMERLPLHAGEQPRQVRPRDTACD